MAGSVGRRINACSIAMCAEARSPNCAWPAANVRWAACVLRSAAGAAEISCTASAAAPRRSCSMACATSCSALTGLGRVIEWKGQVVACHDFGIAFHGLSSRLLRHWQFFCKSGCFDDGLTVPRVMWRSASAALLFSVRCLPARSCQAHSLPR